MIAVRIALTFARVLMPGKCFRKITSSFLWKRSPINAAFAPSKLPPGPCPKPSSNGIPTGHMVIRAKRSSSANSSVVPFTRAAIPSPSVMSDATHAKDSLPRGWSGLTTWQGKPMGVCSPKSAIMDPLFALASWTTLKESS